MHRSDSISAHRKADELASMMSDSRSTTRSTSPAGILVRLSRGEAVCATATLVLSSPTRVGSINMTRVTALLKLVVSLLGS